MKTTAEQDAQAGTLTAMIEGYHENVLQHCQPQSMHVSAMLDFNAGAMAALTLVNSQINKGEQPGPLLDRLLHEGHVIHDRLNPDNFKRTRQ